MTTPRSLHGHAAGSQERGNALPPAAYSPSDYAWIVDFNNGNSDWNNRDNKYFVRAVRSASPAAASECQGVEFRDLFRAWRNARRRKVPSENQLAFESRLVDSLIELQHEMNTGAWRPKASTCFVAQRPKAREIHAPDFSDRVVHHWLVPQLERIYENRFIAQSYANRRGKGTHAAVAQLQSYFRQLSNSGGGWYLQLDVRNFFNSIHRPTLYAILRAAMRRRGVPLLAQRIAHALIARSPTAAGVVHRSSMKERELVPLHKRLENAQTGCGLPIGNLSSQFFANAYLDRLDQFVKRTLKARRYVRYVDDFVIAHRDREQLVAWHEQIAQFLSVELRLDLKAESKLQPISNGADFLGYVVLPTHLRVRRRVVKHAFAAMLEPQRSRSEARRDQSVLASYLGHFKHAKAWRLCARLSSLSKKGIPK